MDKVKITKDNLKFLLDLLDEAERISYDRCKAESPGIEVDKSLGCAIWMHAFEVGYMEKRKRGCYPWCIWMRCIPQPAGGCGTGDENGSTRIPDEF